MKKLLSIALLIGLLAYCSVSFATVGMRNGLATPVGISTDINLGCAPNGGVNQSLTPDGSTYNILCSPNLATAAVANGGAVSMTTETASVPTSYAYVRIPISNLGQSAIPLPNGIPGQILTLHVISVTGSGTLTVTPALSTGVKSLKFTAVDDEVTLFYIDDTAGWIMTSHVGTITINKTST